MRKTKRELNKYRQERAIELYRFLAELKLNEKETTELKEVLKNYHRENKRLRNEIMRTFNKFKDVLTPREYKILCWRYKDRITLQTIGEAFKISRERIRQIQNQGMEKIKGVIRF